MAPNTSSPTNLAADVNALAATLRRLLRDLDPRDTPVMLAPDVLAAFVAVAKLADAGALLFAKPAAEAREWERKGFASDADWLADRTGTTTGRARADLATSGRLGELPLTGDALRDGRLSPEQAGAITDAAAVNPAAEADLLDLAERESLRQMREEAARRKAQAESDEAKRKRERRIHRERRVRTYTKDGAGHLHAVGPLAAIADIARALNDAVDRTFRERRDVKDREGADAYRFDALRDLTCVRAMAGTKRRVGHRRLGMVRVDLSALRRGTVDDGEICDLPGWGTVSVDEARRLLGDSILNLILTHGDTVTGVVNPSRAPTVAQQLAKLWAGGSCVVSGCNRTVRLEMDHTRDWATTRETRVEDLELKCAHHHALKTYEGWALVDGTGRRPLVPPDHPRHPTNQPDRPASTIARTTERTAEVTAERSPDSTCESGPGTIFEDTG